MTGNRDIHHRRSIRLKWFDYSREGAYFVTVDVLNHQHLFGEVIDRTMHLNECGKIADECWRSIPEHFPNAELDEFVIMPDHIHGIVVIVGKSVGARHAVPLQNNCINDGEFTNNAVPLRNDKLRREQFGKPTRGSLPTIIRSFKSVVSKQINEIWDEPRSHVWQRNYYEHIIRDDNELNRIRQYIMDNPAKLKLNDREQL